MDLRLVVSSMSGPEITDFGYAPANPLRSASPESDEDASSSILFLPSRKSKTLGPFLCSVLDFDAESLLCPRDRLVELASLSLSSSEFEPFAEECEDCEAAEAVEGLLLALSVLDLLGWLEPE